MFDGLFNFFGSVAVKQKDNNVIIGGINTADLLSDISDIWKNNNINKYLFTNIRKYRIVVDQFFLPDVQYIFSQICEYKKRKSSRYRIKKAMELILENTWMKSTITPHPDILDFSQLSNLKHSLYDHQINTLKTYNTKVPQMQLKGFLLSTPPGCITGDSMISIRRGTRRFNTSIRNAYLSFQQEAGEHDWDLKVPTYVRSYVGNEFQYHQIHSIVESGMQPVFLVKLADGKSIRCTNSHLIMTEDGYVRADYILGKKVMIDNRWQRDRISFVEVIAVEYDGLQPTYDIVCDTPYHNFLANDIVVHNSGKTIMSIALSQCLKADLSIYVVPKNTVTTVWFDGIREELGDKARIWASDHDVRISDDYDHYIFHFEALPLALYLAERLKSKRKISFIAIDESHNLNEINSIRTLRLIKLAQTLNCQNTVFASGTPIKALGTEVIPLLRTIDAYFTPEVEARFRSIYGLTARRATDILRNRLGLISHKISEESYMTAPKPIEIDHLVKIPDPKKFLITTIKADMKQFMKDRYNYYQSNMKQYITIYHKAIAAYEKTLKTSQQRQELQTYKKYVEIIIREYDPLRHQAESKFCKDFEKHKILPALAGSLKTQFKDAVSVVKYVKLRVLGECLAIVARRRAECAAELAKHGKLEELVLTADKKTIIFSSYIEALEAGYIHFVRKGFDALRIYGKFTKDLTALVTKFKKEPGVNPLLATLQSLSASQTLTNASVVIFLNHPFREYIRDQAFHRVFRIGQDVQTYIYTCVLDTPEDNISTRTGEILEWSKMQVLSIMGSSDPSDAEGIVHRLELNPKNTSIFAGATQVFRDIMKW